MRAEMLRRAHGDAPRGVARVAMIHVYAYARHVARYDAADVAIDCCYAHYATASFVLLSRSIFMPITRAARLIDTRKRATLPVFHHAAATPPDIAAVTPIIFVLSPMIRCRVVHFAMRFTLPPHFFCLFYDAQRVSASARGAARGYAAQRAAGGAAARHDADTPDI